MTLIDLKRIKKMRYLGTYVHGSGSSGGDLPEDIDIIGKTVAMYGDFELNPTTHFVIDDGSCRMYMRHCSSNGMYSHWDKFKEKPDL